jgi:adenylate cyclase class IV
MSDIISAIYDDRRRYTDLCEKFGEKVRWNRNSDPDCYGIHAKKLEKRAENERKKAEGKEVPIEIEVKLRVNEDVICRLEKELGHSWGGNKWERQENIIYRNKEGFVRFRREDGEVKLTIKGKRLPGKYNERPEVECDLPRDFFDQVLKSGCDDAVIYEKQRASYDYQGCIICLDNLGGQYFVEIEGSRSLIDKNIQSLRLQEYPLVEKDYAQIVLETRKKDDKKSTN